MSIVKKPPVKDTSAVGVTESARAPSEKTEVPASKAKHAVSRETSSAHTSNEKFPGHLASTPTEFQPPIAKMRTRLSKAFSRPLDKKIKKVTLVRDRFTFPEIEYDQLAQLKKRLLNQEVVVKKSELVRAGVMLLTSLDDNDLKKALAKVQSVG